MSSRLAAGCGPGLRRRDRIDRQLDDRSRGLLAKREQILVAGVGGLVARSMSMAVGEYVSVSSQRDAERADVLRERREQATQPEAELRELAGIYVARGLDEDLALKVATQLSARDRLVAQRPARQGRVTGREERDLHPGHCDLWRRVGSSLPRGQSPPVRSGCLAAHVNPDVADAAKRLLERATGERVSVPVAAARTCEELVACFADFIGRSGARALFDRSLALAARDHGWLADAAADQSQSPWVRLRACLEAHEDTALDASVRLVAAMIDLFATFVGLGLTFRILHQQWPDVFAVDAAKENP